MQASAALPSCQGCCICQQGEQARGLHMASMLLQSHCGLQAKYPHTSFHAHQPESMEGWIYLQPFKAQQIERLLGQLTNVVRVIGNRRLPCLVHLIPAAQ